MLDDDLDAGVLGELLADLGEPVVGLVAVDPDLQCAFVVGVYGRRNEQRRASQESKRACELEHGCVPSLRRCHGREIATRMQRSAAPRGALYGRRHLTIRSLVAIGTMVCPGSRSAIAIFEIGNVRARWTHHVADCNERTDREVPSTIQ